MSAMFRGAESFNGDISEWDVSGVTDMSAMFLGAFYFNSDISEWDVSGVTGMSGMFGSATSFNGDISPWDVSGVTYMSAMFAGASSFNGDISPWDVSGVTDMSGMFFDATSFNGDISLWDVSGVTGMSGMFGSATSFNGDISPWDVSGVTDMSGMFFDATSFNGDISLWDVSGVTGMSGMFGSATSFNGDISEWDVSGVTGMFEMFLDADSFTQNLGSWYITLDDTSINDGDATRTVGNISAQNSFLGGRNPTYGIGLGGDSELFALDGTILKLKTIPNHLTKSSYTVNITSTGTFGTNNFHIFDIAVSEGAAVNPLDSYASNPPTAYADFITTWKTTQPGEAVTIPVGGSTGAYTVDWGDGTVANVTGDASHVYASAGEHQIVISGDFTRIYLNNRPVVQAPCDHMSGDCLHQTSPAQKLQSIDQWGNIRWESMNSAFEGASNMAYRANDAPDLSSVTDMSQMFFYAESFNGDISSWDVSGVTDMSDMFSVAVSFNGDISSWNVSSVTDMSYMFDVASSFNSDISSWSVSNVTDMSRMFAQAESFNSDISSWSVSNVTDMSRMFAQAESFNSDISSWDVSGVTDMSYMFLGADSFNGDISPWDVSGVTDMSGMFAGADAFDQNLGKWHIVLGDHSIDDEDASRIVTSISAQNAFLDDQSLRYSIALGGDSDAFEIDGTVLKLKSTPNYTGKSSYTVTISSTGKFGTSNSETFEIRVV